MEFVAQGDTHQPGDDRAQNAGQKPVMWHGSDSLPATQLVSHSSALTIHGSRGAWPATPAASTFSRRGTPGLPPARPAPGAPRLSFHVSTSDQDADLAADVLRQNVTSRYPATP